ncbi:hypothetical protein ACFSC6_20255 [Rufibacter sediminis]|uniref:Lipoprotein n=1 Tax=Rufibacter sediminis TaxID=2762756 RepID=A0ABR6VNQ7_9BACT|nr:hypothetical protein [Rufibacter sediminis]MBC3538783.1 hypothetical protein [Rufibacter sediminis]
MRKLYTHLYLSVFLCLGCHKKAVETPLETIQQKYNCAKGSMEAAHYLMGEDEPIPKLTGLPDGFLIVVDTAYKATNFISSYERYCREEASTLNTADLDWQEGWKKLSVQQKLKEVRKSKAYYIMMADSAHLLNNLGLNQVWVINNTKDTVSVQMQDGSFICVLQAMDRTGKWLPVEYWQFSKCGNSYYDKKFPAKTASSFITKLPKTGNYATKLRFKLLGKGSFYYSNEFVGKIDLCDFTEDSFSYDTYRFKPQPHYKLDSLIELSFE